MISTLSHLARTLVSLRFVTVTLLGLVASLAVAQSSKEFSYDAGLHVLDVPSVNGFLQVDGFFYPNLAAATAAIPTGGRLSIYDALSENDTNGNPITVNPFPNDKAVDVRLAGGVVITTDVPLVMGNGSTLTGSGRVITSFGLGSGTLIAPSIHFPPAMTQLSAPVITCHATGGHLVNNNTTYHIILTQVNNINTYASAVTPGETIAGVEGNVMCSGVGSFFSLTFSTPAQQIPGGFTRFESLGTRVYITAGAAGTEILADPTPTTGNISCGTSTISGACADSTSATVVSLPGTGSPPPKLNTTNPLLALGDKGPYSGSSGGNGFGIRVSNLVVEGIQDAADTTPIDGISCIVNFNSEEQGAIQYVNILNCMGSFPVPGVGFFGFGPTAQNFSMHDFEVNVTMPGLNLSGYTPVYLIGVQPGFKSISDFTINNTQLGNLPSGNYPTAGITLDSSSGHVYNGHCEHVSTCLSVINGSKVIADYLSGGSGPNSPTVTNVVHLDSTTVAADLYGLIQGCTDVSHPNCNTVLDDVNSSTLRESGAFVPTGWYYLGATQPGVSTRNRFSSSNSAPSFYAGQSQFLSSVMTDIPLEIGPGLSVTQTADFFDIFSNSALTTKVFGVTSSGSMIVNGATWTAGSNNGTPVVTASTPLAIAFLTGNITCATCATTASGGTLTLDQVADPASAKTFNIGANALTFSQGGNNTTTVNITDVNASGLTNPLLKITGATGESFATTSALVNIIENTIGTPMLRLSGMASQTGNYITANNATSDIFHVTSGGSVESGNGQFNAIGTNVQASLSSTGTAAINLKPGGSTKLTVTNAGNVSLFGNISTAGTPGLVPTYGTASSTAQTAAIGTTTLCATTCPTGQYEVDIYLDSTVSCATTGPAVVGVSLTWRDEAGAKSAVSLPLVVNGGTTLLSNMALGNTTNSASGHLTLWSVTGNAIQYATNYTGCTSGTGTYAIRAAARMIQ